MNQLGKIIGFCNKNAVALLGSLYLTAILCINSIPLQTLIKIAPVLYLMGLLLIIITHKTPRKKILISLGLSYFLGMLFEILNLKFSHLMGEHVYGYALGPKLCGVPIAMGFNWFLLIVGGYYFSRWFFDSVAMRILATTFFVHIAYTIMDPVCQSLQFWSWSGFYFTLGNYGVRGLMALFLAVGFSIYMKNEENKFASYYYVLTTLLFIVANIIL